MTKDNDVTGGVNKNANNIALPSTVLESIVQTVKYDPDSILNCAHDFPHQHHHGEGETESSADGNNGTEMMDLDSSQTQDQRGKRNAEISISDNITKTIFIRAPALPIQFSLPDCFQVYISILNSNYKLIR